MKTKAITTGIVLILSSILFGTNANAQASVNLKKLEAKADRAYYKKDYKKALELFTRIDSLAHDPISYYDYRIGMCLLSTDNKLDAIPYLENAKKGGQLSFAIDYYLGRAYLFAAMHEEAKFYLSAYARQFMASGMQFTVNEAPTSAEHAVHVEKTMNDVYGFLAVCDGQLNGPAYSKR